MRKGLGTRNWLGMALFFAILVSLAPMIASAAELPATLEEANEQLAALRDGEPQYQAQAATDFHLRNLPQDRAYWLCEIRRAQTVQVLLYGEEWCVITYSGTTGYARTRWLTYFRSLDPFHAAVPGLERQSGIAMIREPVIAAVENYTGNTFAVGDVVAVLSYDGAEATIEMMRSTAALPAEALFYVPLPAWDEAQPGDCIAAYTTYFNETTGGSLSDNRRYNIELAVRRIDGVTLKPGETFSFNAFCGPYRKSNGYLLAPNISEDGTGYGGGVCQLTTTLYNAVLNLPLQVEEWRVHRDIGVAYIKLNFDAAVGSQDFSFTNTLPYPIAIRALAQNGALTVLISRAGASGGD